MILTEIPPGFLAVCVIPSADLWPLDDAVHLSGRIPFPIQACLWQQLRHFGDAAASPKLPIAFCLARK